MSVAFRNLDLSPDSPVTEWPTEGVQAALERGSLPEWRRLMAAIRADPWGRTARQIEEVLSHSRPYGVATLMERAIARARRSAEDAERAVVAAELRELVAQSGLTQGEFARRIGTSPPRLSSYVNCSVVPAATLMVRARNVADGRAPSASQGRTRARSPNRRERG